MLDAPGGDWLSSHNFFTSIIKSILILSPLCLNMSESRHVSVLLFQLQHMEKVQNMVNALYILNDLYIF